MKKAGKIAVTSIAAITSVHAALYLHRSRSGKAIEYCSSNPDITPVGIVKTSAHRSGAGIMPEESLMAFRACVESNDFHTDIFEFDLHSTKDGVLVLLHDDTLDRTTDCEKVFGESEIKAQDKTYAELRRLNIGAKFVDINGNMPYAKYSGDNVPDELKIQRVEDVLDYICANGNYNFIIDIKNPGKLGCRGVDTLYRILEERDLLGRTIFGTFHSELSKYVDRTYPLLRRSASIKEVIEFYYASLFGIEKINVNYVALQIPFRMAGYNLGTARFVNYAHRHNIAVQYWTINTVKEAKYLKSIGADCVMSDYPAEVFNAISND